MLLSEYAIPDYLIQQGLLSAQCVVENGIQVNKVTQRNQNFAVILEDGSGYFLKQGTKNKGVGSVQYEATVYQMMSAFPGTSNLRLNLPAFHAFDERNSVLTLELIKKAADLFEFYAHYKAFPDSLAFCAGQLLGRLHKVSRQSMTDNYTEKIAKLPVPDCFHIYQPTLAYYKNISPAGIEVIKIIQQFPAFEECLSLLAQQWSPSCLIHYDIKLANFVIQDTENEWDRSLKLIDWEFSGFGDPHWDVGSMLCSYLDLWLASSPLLVDGTGNGFLAPSNIPLQQLQQSTRIFCKGYCQASTLNSTEQTVCLVQANKFCAARLIQTAFEHALKAISLDARTTSLLQLGMNILQNPEQSMHELFAISDISIGNAHE